MNVYLNDIDVGAVLIKNIFSEAYSKEKKRQVVLKQIDVSDLRNNAKNVKREWEMAVALSNPRVRI